MPVSQLGQLNTTALAVPDLYVQIVPPQTQYLNGVPTNVLGIVGTASWGPVNSPTVVGNLAQYAAVFGPIQARKYDMGTQVATALMQGANNFKSVRVTDGTDTAASGAFGSTGVTLSSRYTGTFGNGITVTLSAGSQANSWKVVVGAPGLAPEVFDNLAAGLAGNAVWVAIAAAINNGANAVRGASAIIVATAGASAAAPAAGSIMLAGGTDGAGVTAAALVGQDTSPRKGMYALRNSGASVALLSDADDSTTWSTQVAFGLSEGIYLVLTGPSGDNIANAVTVKGAAGIDSFASKLLFGDWVYWLDTYNGNIVRLVSPQGFVAGLLSNLSPQNSSLNKQLQGVVGTQKTNANQVYASAELQQLGQAGIDVITNPCPGGAYFGARFGRNSSSNQMVRGDNYTRMTNYIAYTIDAGMGRFVGELQSDDTRSTASATLGDFFETLKTQGMIKDYSVVLDDSNNLPARVALGYMQADVKVQYLSVAEYFLVNVEGGQSVQILRTSTQAA